MSDTLEHLDALRAAYRAVLFSISLGYAIAVAGCTAISAAPPCPAELLVGDSTTISANATNPGAIPTYLWEVTPTDAGTFADPTAASTTFQAQRAGDATLRLTAADGLFQVIADCTIRIVEGAVAVTLSAAPASVTPGATVTLTCTSVGVTPAATLTIIQSGGPAVDLIQLGPGSARFAAVDVAALTFECVGGTAGGVTGDPAVASVTVAAAGGGGRPGTRGG